MTDVMKWLQQDRKLDGALLAHAQVKAVDHPALGPVAAFQYRRDGRVYAAKFRKPEPKDWRSTQGVTRGLYNADAIRSGEGPIVITEGEIDCLSVIQAGYERAVSLPDGWTADGGKRDALVAAEDDLRRSSCVIVAGDHDEAGASLPKTVANILAGHDVRYAKWPNGCKDANDVLVNFGEGELARCLVNARRVDPEGGFITGISDLPPMSERRVLRTGRDCLDWLMAFEVGAVSVGTGTPGAGKSTFATFAAYYIAMHENIRVGIMAFETHPHRIRDHLARLRTGRPWDDLTTEMRGRCLFKFDEHFRIVHRKFDEGDHHLQWLKTMVYTLAVRDGCKLIIVDPWNELEHLPEPGESMTAYINFALKEIRTWAEQYDTHIALIAHPKKMMTEGKPRSPTGYDIADSAAFFNKPALGWSVHQQEDEDGGKFVRLTTWKVRDRQLYGVEPGQARLSFDPYAMAYAKHQQAATAA